MPLSFRSLSCVSVATGFVEEKNSRSECSGSGVGVSKISVSTIEPFDDPNETLQEEKREIHDKVNQSTTKLGYRDVNMYRSFT